jgi:hypothetical protein
MQEFQTLEYSLINTCSTINGLISYDVLSYIMPIKNFEYKFYKSEDDLVANYGEIIKCKTDTSVRKTFVLKNNSEKSLKNSSIFKIKIGKKFVSLIVTKSSIIIPGVKNIDEVKELIDIFFEKIFHLQNIISDMKKYSIDDWNNYISKFKSFSFCEGKLIAKINNDFNVCDEILDENVCKYLLQMKNEFYSYNDFKDFVNKIYTMDKLYSLNNSKNLTINNNITLYVFSIKLKYKIIKPHLARILDNSGKFLLEFNSKLPHIKVINYYYKISDNIFEFKYIKKENVILLLKQDEDEYNAKTIKEIKNLKSKKQIEIFRTTFIIYSTGTIKYSGNNLDTMARSYNSLNYLINMHENEFKL